MVSVSTFILALLPRRMIEPSPNCLVMEESASSMFLSRAALTAARAALAGGTVRRGFVVGLGGSGSGFGHGGRGLRTNY